MLNASFWTHLDQLVAQSEVIIDRAQGTAHPAFPDMIYPVDYGYLAGTTSADGGGIDVWLGESRAKQVVGMICTVDLLKRDAEIKILLGCTDDEMQTILHFLNDGDFMRGILVNRSQFPQV